MSELSEHLAAIEARFSDSRARHRATLHHIRQEVQAIERTQLPDTLRAPVDNSDLDDDSEFLDVFQGLRKTDQP